MKTTHPTPATFNPELSHTLQAIKFITEHTKKHFQPEPNKDSVLKETDVNTVPAPKTEEPKKNPFHVYPDFPFSVQRDFSDDSIEIAIEVLDYRPGARNFGLDHRDPNYEAGEVEFGDAVVVATGKTIELTELEKEAAESAFWE